MVARWRDRKRFSRSTTVAPISSSDKTRSLSITSTRSSFSKGSLKAISNILKNMTYRLIFTRKENEEKRWPTFRKRDLTCLECSHPESLSLSSHCKYGDKRRPSSLDQWVARKKLARRILAQCTQSDHLQVGNSSRSVRVGVCNQISMFRYHRAAK